MKYRYGFYIISCLMMFYTPAWSLIQTPSETPIEIESDSAAFDQKKGRIIYTGHVIMRQAPHKLTAHRLEMFRDKNGALEKVIATGDLATFSTQLKPKDPEVLGKAKRIEYYPQKEVAYLLKHASLVQADKTIASEQLIYFFKTEKLRSVATTPEERTFVTIYPKQKKHDSNA